MARPRPKPPAARVPRSKRPKMRSRSASGTPSPGSLTAAGRRRPRCPRRRHRSRPAHRGAARYRAAPGARAPGPRVALGPDRRRCVELEADAGGIRVAATSPAIVPRELGELHRLPGRCRAAVEPAEAEQVLGQPREPATWARAAAAPRRTPPRSAARRTRAPPPEVPPCPAADANGVRSSCEAVARKAGGRAPRRAAASASAPGRGPPRRPRRGRSRAPAAARSPRRPAGARRGAGAPGGRRSPKPSAMPRAAASTMATPPATGTARRTTATAARLSSSDLRSTSVRRPARVRTGGDDDGLAVSDLVADVAGPREAGVHQPLGRGRPRLDALGVGVSQFDAVQASSSATRPWIRRRQLAYQGVLARRALP